MEESPQTVLPPSLEPSVGLPVIEVKPPSKKKILIPVVISLAVILILASIYFAFTFIKSQFVPGTGPTPAGVASSQDYWINCKDIRKVIDDNGSFYVACGDGGVIVVNKNTGEVTDQIGEPDGLGNQTATSMIKKGNVLYIGTQDGMTIFDLKSRQAKKISVAEGLPSGANIELSEDGDDIWIATFNGAALYDTLTGKLTSFTDQLDSQATARDISDIFVTKKYVYLLENSDVYSSGAVIRYEKSSGSFKTYKPDSFGVTGPNAYVNFISIQSFGNSVYVSDDRNIYKIDEETDASWEKVESPVTFIKKDLGDNFSFVKILGNVDPDGILLIANTKVYLYSPGSGLTKEVYDFGNDNASPIDSSDGRTLWFTPNNEADGWLQALDLDSIDITKYSLKDRPEDFGRILALIDDEPIIDNTFGIFKYSSDQNKFVLLTNPSASPEGSFGQDIFQPIPGSGNVLMLNQSCQMNCSKPVITLYNYTDGTSTPLDMPASVLFEIAYNSEVYQQLSLSWMNTGSGEIGFSYLSGPSDQTTKYFVYNVISNSWSKAVEIPEGVQRFDQINGVVCNNVYSFASNQNKFSDLKCSGFARNGSVSWEVTDVVLYQDDSLTKSHEALNPPAEAPDYNPFGWTDKGTSFGPLMFVDGKLWIGSDRGLLSYDSTNGAYKLYGSAQGLLSKNVLGFLVGKHIWVVTNGGGLSEVAY